MADNRWFNNHGQALATTGTVGSFLIALLINWNAITQHQDLLAWLPVIAVPLAIYGAFRVGRSSRPAERGPVHVVEPPPVEPKAETPAAEPKLSFLGKQSDRFELDQDSIFIEERTVKLGGYCELGSDLGRWKIAPMSLQPLDRNEQGVEIRFDTQGSMFYGGADTKGTGTNRFILGATRSGFQAEPHCAHQFSFSDRHVHLRVVRVEHINAVSNEVVLEICAVSLRRLPRALP